jgi:hypothetical protein
MRCMLLLVLSLSSVAAFAATQLAIATQPGGGPGGLPWAQQPVVEAQDSVGAVDGAFTGFVTAEITPGTGASNATLIGTVTVGAATVGPVTVGAATVRAVAGVATFTDLAIDLAGTGYTLSFTATALAPATSAGFDIAIGPAVRLLIIRQPAHDQEPDTEIGPSPRVAVVDAGGNVVASDNSTLITAELAASADTPATLEGTLNQMVISGVAEWPDLEVAVDEPESCRLRFTASGLFPVTSAKMKVIPYYPPSGDCAGACCSTGETIDAWLMFIAAFAATAVALRQRRRG